MGTKNNEWKLVPTGVTKEMRDAANLVWVTTPGCDIEAIYAAMLAAAPAPTDQQGQERPNADCSGDPSNCPDNEGYGCACGYGAAPASAKPVAPEKPPLMEALAREDLSRWKRWALEAEAAIQQRQAPTPIVARDWIEDAPHENGNYQCLCSTCGNTFIGHKRRVTCKACSQQAEAAPVASAEQFDLDMLADACVQVEISDSQYESLCIALRSISPVAQAAPAPADEQKDCACGGWTDSTGAYHEQGCPEPDAAPVDPAAEVVADTRSQFEREALRLSILDDEGLERNEAGDYIDEPAQAAWKAWRAALASRSGAEVRSDDLLPISRSTYGSLEECQKEQARRDALAQHSTKEVSSEAQPVSRDAVRELLAAADATVERWHSRDWKQPHTADFIARLAKAVGALKSQAAATAASKEGEQQ